MATITSFPLATTPYVTSSGATEPRTISDRLSDYMSVKDFGADTSETAANNFTAFTAAIASGKPVYVPPGEWSISSSLNMAVNGKIFGAGNENTILRFPSGTNCIRMNNYAVLSDLTVDGTVVDDVAGATGVLFNDSDGNGVTGARVVRVRSKNQGFHGYAFPVTANENWIIDCVAEDCGHRGINMSAQSSRNKVLGFHAENCWRAGIIMGYGACDNIFDDIYIDGVKQSSGGAALWMHYNCDRNIITNVVIGPQQSASGTTCPAVLLGASCQNNILDNFIINGIGSRAVYVWNFDNDSTADAASLTESNISGNRLNNFTIIGTSVASSYGLGLNEATTDTGLTITENQFTNFRIVNVATGIKDVASSRAMTGTGNDFGNFKFSGTSTDSDIPIVTNPRYWNVGTTGNQVRNPVGVSLGGRALINGAFFDARVSTNIRYVIRNSSVVSGVSISAVNDANSGTKGIEFVGSDYVFSGSAPVNANYTGVKINGQTSGSITHKSASIAGANTITWPAGTTDFSATGGASQVVKQGSAGGALTVEQLAQADISGLGTGDSPQFASVNIGAATDTTLGRTSPGVVNVEGVDLLSTNTGAKLAGGQNLTGGFTTTSYSLGTVSSGTLTPNPANGHIQHYTNGGAHTLAPPANPCTIVIECANSSAGAITTSGFSVVSGDAYDSSGTKKHIFRLTKTNSYSELNISYVTGT